MRRRRLVTGLRIITLLAAVDAGGTLAASQSILPIGSRVRRIS